MKLIKFMRIHLAALLSAVALSIASPAAVYASEQAPHTVPQDLVFMVEFNIKPESRDAFLSSLTQVIDDMSKEDTYVITYLHQDSEDPNKFVIYERWKEPSLEAFMENQLKAKVYRNDYEERLPGWSSQPRKITILKPIIEK